MNKTNINKKDRFDPKTLKPFDKVLVRDDESLTWKTNMFSYIDNNKKYPYVCLLSCYRYCIPYNEETKHLVGTTDEAPEYYRYWKDDRKDDCKHNTEDIF